MIKAIITLLFAIVPSVVVWLHTAHRPAGRLGRKQPLQGLSGTLPHGIHVARGHKLFVK